MIRVFMADDHTLVRDGIKQLLATAGDIEVVAEAADGRAALNQLDAVACDVLLLDLSLPIVSGIEVLRRVKKTRPELPILILSMYPEQQHALQLLRSGAAGYLCKDRSEDELVDAIRALAKGKRYLTTTVAAQSMEAADGDARHLSLTARECEVFTLLCEGRSVTEIAAEIDVTASTVSTLLAHVRQKLGVHTTGEIIAYGFRAGLVK